MERKIETRMEERLPQVVEDRLQEAYGRIRSGEVKQMKHKMYSYRRWTSVAAACAVIVTASVGVLAAAAYFQKEVHQETDELTYTFSLNYDLVPGTYEVTPAYLPKGYEARGDGKYSGDDMLGISVLPVYNTAELEKLDGEIALNGIDKVEHTTLSGMEADVITFKEAQKYEKNTYIFLFNTEEGCVIQLSASSRVDMEELMKFADHLSVERTGDDAYETEEEKQSRVQEEKALEDMETQSRSTWDALLEAGIPSEKLLAVGEELKLQSGYGYTVTDYEFVDSIQGFDKNKFFDYSRFDGWVQEDGTLKPYARQYYGENGQLLAEDQAEQTILKVDMDVHCYDNSVEKEAPLDFALQYVEKRSDGSLTWESGWYVAVPSEHYELQMDQSAVYLDGAVHRDDADRKDYFFRSMEKGEDFSFTLLFVVDKDRMENFVLSPVSGNYDLDQSGTMTAQEILKGLDGYIQLK